MRPVGRVHRPGAGLSPVLPALAERATSVDWFWHQPDRYINQILRSLLLNRRFVAQDGLIIGTADAPPHNHY